MPEHAADAIEQGRGSISSDTALLDVDRLCKRFQTREGTWLEVTRDLSFSLAPREFLGIVGPSGAGKTTLLRTISGLSAPSGGEVRYQGAPVSDVPSSVSIVFQEYNKSLFPWFSVRKNVAIGARTLGKGEAAERVDAALAQVGLSEFASVYPWELSGGMQQRVALARAMVSDPRLLLMDEPFASVDALTRSHLEDVVLQLWEQSNFGCLLVTHDVSEAVYLCDRVLVLSARPSAILAEIVIDLPRPRSQQATRLLPRFAELQAGVLERVEHAGRSAVGTPIGLPSRPR